MVTWERAGAGQVLADRHAPVETWPIDWELLDRRRSAELTQLDAVQKYAYTKGCRRAFVLRYFGDRTPTGACTRCDNCAGDHRAAAAGDVSPARTKVRRGKGSGESDSSLSSEQEAALARLRTLRTSLAKAQGVPAYVVFADRTLRDIARQQPRSLNDLGTISGVGPVKLERYGSSFLEALARH
jgi:ATP-dependent DNA helicase RecQ